MGPSCYLLYNKIHDLFNCSGPMIKSSVIPLLPNQPANENNERVKAAPIGLRNLFPGLGPPGCEKISWYIEQRCIPTDLAQDLESDFPREWTCNQKMINSFGRLGT